MATIYYLHKASCSRTRSMGDPLCYACRKAHARVMRIFRSNIYRHKLKSTGAAHRDRLVAAALNIRSDDRSIRT